MTISPPIHVQVTHTNISEASRTDAGRCPIALAIKSSTQGARVAVSPTFACVEGVVHMLPAVAVRFVENFDRGHKNLMPFEFDLMP